MPPKVVEKFEVDYVQILDEQGNVVPGAIVPKLSDRVLQEKYEMMKFLRAFDNKALALQRQGRMGTYSEFKGQEAIQVGAMMSLEEKDWFFPTYRDSGAIIARGVAPESIFRYWSGDEEGQNFPPGVHVFPIAIPVASQIPHAVGGAWVLKHRNPGSIALVTIGDGGTSKADFYEGMNLAGVFNVPVVCLIQNNQYAITLPRGFQTASSTLAQKGLAFGIGGIQVDGNDLLAVYTVICKAADRARRGEGASLVECITYRLGHHTTATGDEPYRSEEEIEKWKHRDPIERFRRYLERRGLWSEDMEKEIDSRVKLKIDEAVRMFESFPRPSPNEMFRYTYGEMPSKLKGQEKYLSRFLENSTSQEAQTKRSSARSEAKSVEQI
ncbi:MAG TPA: pyruvate dehydrogenase (acetyl-transferring) E1 component subunit alpha [Nitrososphaerales archaeon]|nr:pyruvate dehydrogenase (acetyl-transferring) E1 component subunit alpha [Nitrososphaerales archaeon]